MFSLIDFTMLVLNPVRLRFLTVR